MDFYGFYTGTEFEAYRFLGAETVAEGVVFRTFAPDASRISVIGDFNNWEESPMERRYDGNFWELWIANAREGMRYKYRIYRQDGSCTDHCDPYGFGMELRPASASVIYDLNKYSFQDEAWMEKRTTCFDQPFQIYELHFGSWRKKGAELTDWYSYQELAELLIPYLKENGYNYVELLPLSEHPCDNSWGYQNTGFFAPTSRYGTPEGLMAFVDCCHQHDIGVLMDFVPVHFAVDDYGLWNYDGTPLYEYPHAAVGVSEWGSCNFMHSRGEVRSFLQSAAYYWLKEYHFDGLRVDAVSNLIYWQGDPGRGVNNSAIQFLQTMNRGLKERIPEAILIAEDSSAYPGVTRPCSEQGLGFDYKWDLGWMNDTLNYFRTGAAYRPENYHKLTFSMMYYYNERYLLPLSHDEVVHGKATIMQKMSGDYEDKFPQARALYLYMMGHPGKKLNFMGNEFGQLREWDETREQDWDMLKYPIHDAFYHFMRDLNGLYLSHPAMYQEDYANTGFTWLDCHQESRCIYAFERCCISQRLIFVFNFSDIVQEDYALPIEETGQLRLLLDTDWEPYHGATPKKEAVLPIIKKEATLTLPPYSGRCYALEINLSSTNPKASDTKTSPVIDEP